MGLRPRPPPFGVKSAGAPEAWVAVQAFDTGGSLLYAGTGGARNRLRKRTGKLVFDGYLKQDISTVFLAQRHLRKNSLDQSSFFSVQKTKKPTNCVLFQMPENDTRLRFRNRTELHQDKLRFFKVIVVWFEWTFSSLRLRFQLNHLILLKTAQQGNKMKPSFFGQQAVCRKSKLWSVGLRSKIQKSHPLT